MALPENIRLGWEGTASEQYSSLFAPFIKYGIKKLYNVGPRSQSYKTFQSSNTHFRKLHRFSSMVNKLHDYEMVHLKNKSKELRFLNNLA